MRITPVEGERAGKARRVNWIMQRWFHYMWRAVLNGYPIMLHRGPVIKLEMEEARTLTEEEKRRYRQSRIKFGYMFRISLENEKFPKGWTFYPAPEIMDRLQEILDSDKIYELTKS